MLDMGPIASIYQLHLELLVTQLLPNIVICTISIVVPTQVDGGTA